MSKARILIVEDETIVALDLEGRLLTLGYDVVDTITTGERAIERAEELEPDLVLMDINLAGELDGIQAAKVIRKRYKVPVIFLTACIDDGTLQRAKVTEPFAYIIKPFEDRELHGHIEIALYKHETELQLRDSEERYSLAAQGANDGLWDWDLETNEVYYSPRWEALLGFSPGEFPKDSDGWLSRVHPSDQERLQAEIKDHVKGATPQFQSEYRILHKDGSYRWMLTRGLAVRDGNDRVFRMAGTQTDITERKLFDPLTGLPNKALFIDRLERAFEREQRTEGFAFAVLALQSDVFGKVKENIGYTEGDTLLTQFTEQLQASLSDGDTLVNLGEEEFAVLVEETDLSQASSLAARLQQQFTAPFQLEGQDIYIQINIGIAHSATGYRKAEEILRDAQTAVHRAAELGTSNCEIFDQKMRSKAVSRLRLETELRQALEREEFVLYYQPIVSLTDGKLVGFEALLRWKHRDETIITPDQFIPLAEETGLIIPLERWVLWKACTELKGWHESGANNNLTLSVNFSGEQYRQPDTVEMVRETLLKTGLDPKTLKLEITESTFLEDSDNLFHLLSKIQDLDVQLHMDDFGTGYSSLSYLHRFPINVLKIDRSFVNDMELNSRTRQIVKAIANLGQNLQMGVTAEGIETPDQLEELRLLRCDFGQGYLFSRPMDSEQAKKLILEGGSWGEAFGPASQDARESKTIRIASREDEMLLRRTGS